MNPWIAKNVFYLPIERLRGEPITRYMREIAEFEHLSSEEMSALQWDRLKALLDHAYKNNSFYRQQFDRVGIIPEDIKSPADFERVPFLTKKLLRENFASMMSKSVGKVSLRKTSGSTGTPLKLAKDRTATAYMEAYMYHVYSWYGIEIGTRQGRVWGMPFGFSGRSMTRVKDVLLNRRRLVSFELSRDACRLYYHHLKKFKPYFLYGLIAPISEFARELAGCGIDPKELGLKVIIATGERLHPGKKEHAERAFGCRVVNEYGCTESGIIAFECPSGNLHVANHNLLVEIVNPETGVAVAAGESGEVVLTELFATGMPLIRYRIGDLACKSNERCTCGRQSPIIGSVIGRTSELIPTPDGRKVAAALLDYAIPSSVSRFRAILTEVDRLELLLECPQPLTEDERDSIKNKMSQYLGKQMRIELRIVGSIPSDPSGKLRCFESRI